MDFRTIVYTYLLSTFKLGEDKGTRHVNISPHREELIHSLGQLVDTAIIAFPCYKLICISFISEEYLEYTSPVRMHFHTHL